LVAIAGATGTGKSDLALILAEELQGEIVNCDSIQLYRYMDIGSAKMPVGQRRGIPHHLFDVLDPDQHFTAGDYARRARGVLEEIRARGRVPVVIGGTGFYLRALLNGLFEAPARDLQLRQRLGRRSGARLHKLLARWDPQAAARIHPNDKNKLIRALEVTLLERKPIGLLWTEKKTKPLEGFAVLKIGLEPPREKLNRRLDERSRLMFETGLLDEVQGILARGFAVDSKALRSIGYRQAVAVLQGHLTLEQAIADTQTATRQYAKRQRTWFRREPGVHWIPRFGVETETIETSKRLIRGPRRQ
jgi:tRNA dimethylallyltransferase